MRIVQQPARYPIVSYLFGASSHPYNVPFILKIFHLYTCTHLDDFIGGLTLLSNNHNYLTILNGSDDAARTVKKNCLFDHFV